MRTLQRLLLRGRSSAGAAALAALLALGGACDGEGAAEESPCGRPGEPSGGEAGLPSGLAPLVEVQPAFPAGGHVFDIDAVAPGGGAEAAYELIDSGAVVLAVTRLRWEYERADPALSCTYGPHDTPCGDPGGLPACVAPILTDPAAGEVATLPLRVRYRRVDDTPRHARLVVESDGRGGALVLAFAAEDVAPRLLVTPTEVVFRGGQRGEVREEHVLVLNAGRADLVIAAPELEGDPEFALPVAADPPPWTLAPATSRPLVVTLRRDTPAARAGTLRLRSNDPAAEWTEVALVAEPVARQLGVEPAALEFVGLEGSEAGLPLTLRADGAEPVSVAAVTLAGADDAVFRLEPPVTEGFTLDPGAARALTVVYAPDHGPGGPPDEGAVVLASDGWEPEVTVPLTGRTGDPCPHVVLAVAEGTAVPPGTTLHLSGDGSWSDFGAVTSWEWSVEQPDRSYELFLPSPLIPNPTFTVNLVGPHRFCLAVRDERGVWSCEPACVDVDVAPTAALHVELLWSTPGDPSAEDTGPWAGSDLDLHLVHPAAPSDPAAPDRDGDGLPDPWFDVVYDCYWSNPQPDWGTAGGSDDPRLDREDGDGWGPEVIRMAAPEEGARYRLAAHYGNDHGFGPSYATVRVYVRGALAFEWLDVLLRIFDLWCVAAVDWPSGAVTRCEAEDGGFLITPNYRPALVGE